MLGVELQASLKKETYKFRKLLRAVSPGNKPVLGGIYDAVYWKRISVEVKKLSSKPPLHVNIENTNLCGAKCVMCPNRIMTRPKGTMSFMLYKKIIDECVTFGVKRIQIGECGEPLLDPLIYERISYAKKKGVERVNLFTNAAFLTENSAYKILSSGLDLIIISLDAVRESTFNEIRPKLNFTQTITNVRTFLTLRAKSADKTPMVALNFTASEKNEHEIIPFIKEWTPMIKKISIRIVHDWAGQLAPIQDLKERRYPCKRLWTGVSIAWNGDVLLCCLDYDGKVVLGSVCENSLKSIWTGERIRKIRQKHLQGKFGDVPLCKNCSGADTIPWISWWLKIP